MVRARGRVHVRFLRPARGARAASRRAGARVYHFRAGFGQSSIPLAQQLGMHVICDHAIAHPVVMDELIRNRGRSARLDGGSSAATETPS